MIHCDLKTWGSNNIKLNWNYNLRGLDLGLRYIIRYWYLCMNIIEWIGILQKKKSFMKSKWFLKEKKNRQESKTIVGYYIIYTHSHKHAVFFSCVVLCFSYCPNTVLRPSVQHAIKNWRSRYQRKETCLKKNQGRKATGRTESSSQSMYHLAVSL